MITEKEKDKKKKHIAKYKKEYYLKNEENIKKYRKEYSLKNKEKIAKYCKEYNLKNKESKIKYNKKYRLNNKEHLSKVKLNYQREQYKNNPNFKLKRNLRGRVWSALKGISKSAPTMELIGCSVDKLWNHLESKFKPWMTKENYGLWHVDHIIACANFDLTCPEQQRTCFHYTNLQPLEAIENMRKGDR